MEKRAMIMIKMGKPLEDVFESAVQNSMKYSGCTQAVLAALQKHLDVGNREMFKAASALAGGVARQGETCGALIGAIMAISSLVGRERLEDIEQYQKAMEPAMKMYSMFKDEVGDTLCREIHKIRYGRYYRLFIPEERKAFQDIGGSSRKGCPEVCGIAARIASKFILDIKEL